jgi:hypothetical protein
MWHSVLQSVVDKEEGRLQLDVPAPLAMTRATRAAPKRINMRGSEHANFVRNGMTCNSVALSGGGGKGAGRTCAAAANANLATHLRGFWAFIAHRWHHEHKIR